MVFPELQNVPAVGTVDVSFDGGSVLDVIRLFEFSPASALLTATESRCNDQTECPS